MPRGRWSLKPTLYRLAGVSKQPWAGAMAEVPLFVQRPVVLTSSGETTCSIGSGTTLLVNLGSFAPDVSNSHPTLKPDVPDPPFDAATEERIRLGRQLHAFLLVTPTILNVNPTR